MENKEESLSFKRDFSSVGSWIKKHRLISGFGLLIILVSVLPILFPTNQPMSRPSVASAAAVQQLTAYEQKYYDAGLMGDTIDSNGTIYVTSAWYVLTVQQKDEFLQTLGQLKKAAYGSYAFEVHDIRSNEKVGDVNWLGSPEVDQ